MPIYEYQCANCDHKFEKLQKLSDPLLKNCPECHEDRLRKLVSAAGFRLKGGGWYETDFKQGNKKNLVEKETTGDSKDKADKSSDSSSSDKKPAKDAAKKESKPAKSSEAASSSSV